MHTSSPAADAAASPESGTTDRFVYFMLNDVFASLTDGGSISVEEWPNGDLQRIAKRVEPEKGIMLLQLDNDEVGGAPHDVVSVHPDESDRLAMIDRAIEALENARAALKACGYRDYSDIRAAFIRGETR